MSNIEKLKILGLSKHERKIIRAIKNKTLNITDLSKSTCFPRTTLYTALSSLADRGLIFTRKSGRSMMVNLVSNRKVFDLLDSTAKTFQKQNVIRVSKKDKDDSGFNVVYGKKSLLEALTELLNNPKERVLAIQSTKSMLNAVKAFKPGKFIPINKSIRKNKIIMEAILRNDYINSYMNLYRDNKKVQKKILESLAGRLSDMTLVDNKYLNDNAELILTSDEAMLVNWKSEVGIKIENPDMVSFLRELFYLAKGYGRKVNYSKYIEEQMNKLSYSPK